MYQPHPASGQPAEPQRPAASAARRTAVKLMCAGAAVGAAPLACPPGSALGRPPRHRRATTTQHRSDHLRTSASGLRRIGEPTDAGTSQAELRSGDGPAEYAAAPLHRKGRVASPSEMAFGHP
jgi:hypothetical protein